MKYLHWYRSVPIAHLTWRMSTRTCSSVQPRYWLLLTVIGEFVSYVVFLPFMVNKVSYNSTAAIMLYSPSCILMWVLRLQRRANFFPQRSQQWGLSPARQKKTSVILQISCKSSVQFSSSSSAGDWLDSLLKCALRSYITMGYRTVRRALSYHRAYHRELQKDEILSVEPAKIAILWF